MSLGQAVRCSLPSSLGDTCPWRKEWGKKRRMEELLPEGECACALGPLSKGFYLCLAGGILGEVSGEGFSRIFIILQVGPFRVKTCTDWSMAVQGIFSHCSWFWLCSPGFAVFLGLEQKRSWGLDVIFREEMFLFSQLWPLLGTGPSNLVTWL